VIVIVKANVRRVVRGLGRRAGALRGEVQVRRQRLHDYVPVPLVVGTRSEVRRARVPAVDVHNHLGRWLNNGRSWMVADPGALVAMMDDLNVATVVNLDGRWGGELEANLDRYDRAHPGRFVTFCHLDWSALGEVGGERRLPESLDRAVAAGAGGIKVWKDLGLEVRDHAGRLVAPDDPRLGEVWERAADLGLPVLIHVADPVAFWRPVDRHNERFEQLARHPEWQYGSRQVPAHGELVDALERLLAAHRRTTFIAAHVASHAENLPKVSRMLREHPNLSVDLAACEAELGRQPGATRRFLRDHVDRVMWGSDAFPFSAPRFHTWFRLLETADEHFPYGESEVPEQGRWAVSGFELEQPVLDALYADNARRLVPALRSASAG
jgi:predicted TIM-barrel fold metal-dependent hydrolase